MPTTRPARHACPAAHCPPAELPPLLRCQRLGQRRAQRAILVGVHHINHPQLALQAGQWAGNVVAMSTPQCRLPPCGSTPPSQPLKVLPCKQASKLRATPLQSAAGHPPAPRPPAGRTRSSSTAAPRAPSPCSCATRTSAASHTRAMVAASSSTKTPTGSAPWRRAAAAICRAVAVATLRLALGHRIMPIRLAPVQEWRGGAGRGKTERQVSKLGREARGRRRAQLLQRHGPGTLHCTPVEAASSASSALVTPQTLMNCSACSAAPALAAGPVQRRALRLQHQGRCQCAWH